MPALPLNPEQKADAERLKVLFKSWQQLRKDRGQPSSQDDVASLFGFGQSALSQYLNGKIPLNVEALTKFADLLGCSPEAISPELAKTISRYATHTATTALSVGEAEAPYAPRKTAARLIEAPTWPFPRIAEARLRALPAADLARVEGAIALAMAQLGLEMDVAPVVLATHYAAGSGVKTQEPGDVLPAGAAANDDYIEINQYDVRFAAGEGTLAFDANPRNKLAFRRSFLRTERLRARNLIVVYAQGDSMEPVIPHRAALLIDRAARDLEDGANGKIFGFRLDGELRVKRLERLDDGSICAHSFNPAYKPIHLDGSKDFEIIGRVVWMGTRL